MTISPRLGLPKHVDVRSYDMEWYPESYDLRMICVDAGQLDKRAYIRRNLGQRWETTAELAERFCHGEITPENDRCWYYAHAGGLADIQFLLPVFARLGYRVRGYMSGSALIMADVQTHGCRLRFVDSYFLLKAPLKDVGRSFGLEKIELDDFSAPDDVLLPYCERDAAIVRVAVEAVQDTVNALGGSLRSTIASTAQDLAHARYLSAPIATKRRINEVMESAYFGGRVEVFERGEISRDMYWYDINSSYPHAMRSPLPGKFLRTQRSIPRETDMPWVAEVTVDVPSHVERPPLPVRLGEQRRLYFPSGTFRGLWCAPELEYAESIGCKILDVHQVYAFAPCTFLREFAEEIYALRCTFPKDSAEYQTYKYLLASCYGKYGQREETRNLLINPRVEPDEPGSYVSPNVYMVESLAPVPYRHLPLTSYITAIARSNIGRHMDRGRRVVYVDTDGFLCSSSPREMGIGESLGDLKLEKDIVRANFQAPKLYLYETREPDKNGKKVHVRSKGFFGQDPLPDGSQRNRPLNAEEYYRLASGGTVKYKTMCRVRKLLKSLSERDRPWDVPVTKSLKDTAIPKRRFFPDGTSEAWDYETIAKMESLH